ncbi:MAG TPA: helix-turn-helix domain-containing protein [Anaeromyxobacteraceae bacterium]|nr:helix-turn-helix domain-containing protein [Anaeromyxobacteraceae bacterium]
MQRRAPVNDASEGRGGLPGVLEFTQDLWALVHSLDTRSKWMHRTYGVTVPQRLLIRMVGLWPGCSPGEAARLLRLHPASVTRLVAGLERLDLVRRSRDRADARRLRLRLTARGRRIGALRAGTVEQAVQRALQRAGPANVAVARRFVNSLSRELLPAKGS